MIAIQKLLVGPILQKNTKNAPIYLKFETQHWWSSPSNNTEPKANSLKPIGVPQVQENVMAAETLILH